MKLHTYESVVGWRWTVEQKEPNKDDKGLHTVIIGSSNTSFETAQEALDDAKHLALGILDAFASRAIEDHVSGETPEITKADLSGEGS